MTNPSTNLDASVNIVNSLVQGIEFSFPTATRQAPWLLRYQAFRDTIPPSKAQTDKEGKSKYAHTFQHLLHLSSLDQSTTYICIEPPTGKSTVTGIPLRQQEAHALMVRNQVAALWQLRHSLSLLQGATYSAGLCHIQLGELRAAREGPQSAAVSSPGVVICISTTICDDEEDNDAPMQANGTDPADDELPDFEYAQEIIRACWSTIKGNLDLGRSEVREVMMAQEAVKGTQEKEAVIRMWSEVLRLRG